MSWLSKWFKVEPVATMEDLVLIAKEVEEIKQDLVNTMVMVQKHKEEIRLLKGGVTPRLDEPYYVTRGPTKDRTYRGYDSYEYIPPRKDEGVDTALVLASTVIASSSYDDSSSSSSSYNSSSSSSSYDSSSSSDSSSCGGGD